jgi:magnesium transporter
MAETFLDRDPRQFDHLESLIGAEKRTEVLETVSDWHPGDIVDLLIRLPFRLAQRVFDWLPVPTAGRSLAEMKPAFLATLLGDIPLPRIVALVDVLETDDATDVVAHLPPELARRVLRGLEDEIEVKELLNYEADTAGGIMSARYIAVPVDATVAQATEQVRAHADLLEEIFAVFVTDEHGHLAGAVNLKTLLLSSANAKVADIMNTEVMSVQADVDQEHAAQLMERYDLVALPVVDAESALVGCITIDDAVDVLREEAEEDISRISGAPSQEVPNQPVFLMAAGRLPWLLAGLMGAALSGMVVGSFEDALQQAVILASLIPVVMAMAGNAGIQSAAVAVQGLASGRTWSVGVGRRLLRELLVALLNGIAVALLLAGLILIVSAVITMRAPLHLALTAAVSLVIVIFLAGTIGAVTPIVLNRLGIDPALATGPVITTSNDVLGVLVFFSVATLLYIGV